MIIIASYSSKEETQQIIDGVRHTGFVIAAKPSVPTSSDGPHAYAQKEINLALMNEHSLYRGRQDSGAPMSHNTRGIVFVPRLG